MSYIISFILPLIYIVFYTYSLSIIFKSKFEHDIPLTFIVSAIIMYISLYIFNTLYVGLIFNILITLVFPIYIIKNKYTFKEIKNKYINNGLICFIVFYVLVYLYDLNRMFTSWDELSHWGKMIKEILRLDNFYSVPASHLLVHKDYPPIMSLMETMFIFISGGFKETYLIRCIHLFEGSIIVSILPSSKKLDIKNTNIKTILVFIFMYILTFLFDSEAFINSIYIDFALSFLSSYILFNIYKEKNNNMNFFIRISLMLIFLLLTKQVAIAFYLMSIFFLFLNIIKEKKNIFSNILKYIIFVLIIPLVFLYSWNIYKINLGLVGQFEIKNIEFDSIYEIYKGKSGEDYQIEASKNYCHALTHENITSSYVQITYAHMFIIISVFVILIYYLLNKNIDKDKYKFLSLTLFIGYFGYILLMYLLYVFLFGPYEGPTLASFDRYMSTYVLVCLYVLAFIYLYHKDINCKKIIIITITIMLLMRPHQYLRLRPDLIIFTNHKYDEAIKAATLIDRYVEDDSKVFIIDQVEKDGAVFYINYFSDKITTNLVNYDVNPSSNILEGYKYLYTYTLDESSDLELHTLYRIDSKYNLIKVERS